MCVAQRAGAIGEEDRVVVDVPSAPRRSRGTVLDERRGGTDRWRDLHEVVDQLRDFEHSARAEPHKHVDVFVRKTVSAAVS